MRSWRPVTSRLIAWFSCNSPIWTRSSPSTTKNSGLKRTSVANTPASAPSGSRASSRSDNAEVGGPRQRPAFQSATMLLSLAGRRDSNRTRRECAKPSSSGNLPRTDSSRNRSLPSIHNLPNRNLCHSRRSLCNLRSLCHSRRSRGLQQAVRPARRFPCRTRRTCPD